MTSWSRSVPRPKTPNDGYQSAERPRSGGRRTRGRRPRAGRDPREPRRRRHRLDVGRRHARCATAASRCAPTSTPTRPIPHEVSFLETKGLEREIDPASLEGWTVLAVDCGNERRHRPRLRGDSRGAPTSSSTSTTTTTTAALAPSTWSTASASSTAEILARIFDGLGRRAHAEDRRGAVRRPRDRHRPVPVPHHEPGRAAAGGAAGRGRRRRPQGVRAGVRADAVRQAAAARPRDRKRRAVSRAAGSRSPTSAATTSHTWTATRPRPRA